MTILNAQIVSGNPDTIQPATSRRGWMDASNDKFAYRCLPLSMANGWGWEILSSAHFIAEWNGGPAPSDVNITVLDGVNPPSAHFGVGTFTWHTGYMFTTEYPYALYVGGIPNNPTPNVMPLSGIVETYWLPFTFTMNWKFTQLGTFEMKIGEPYCQIFPVDISIFDKFKPEIHDLVREDNKELVDLYVDWNLSRRKYGIDSRYHKLESNKTWQRNYFQGNHPPDNTRKCPVIHQADGSEKSVHRTKPNPSKFVNKTTKKYAEYPVRFHEESKKLTELEKKYALETKRKVKNINKFSLKPLDTALVESRLEEFTEKVLQDAKKHNN